MELHPQYIEHNGKQEYVVLPISEFQKMQELLEDAEDLLLLRAAKAESKPHERKTLAEVMKKFGVSP